MLVGGNLYITQYCSLKLRHQYSSWCCLVLVVVHCVVAKSCPTFCDPKNCSTPGFPVLHYLPEFAQTHVHWVSDAIQPSHPVAPFSSCPQSFPASGSFPVSRLFTSGGQSIRASASASVLPMNIQGWFPLGTDCLDLLAVRGTRKSLLQHHSSRVLSQKTSLF